MDLVCTHFPDPQKRLRVSSKETGWKIFVKKLSFSRRLSERESELVVAEEVPLPGLKGPSDYEAPSPLPCMFGPKVGCTFFAALALGDLKACVRMSHYRFGGKTQLPGFESERGKHCHGLTIIFFL